MSSRYTAIVQRDGPWWIGWVEEIPGVNSQGATREELLDTVEQAIFPHLECFRQTLVDRSHLVMTLPQSILASDIPVHQETLQALQHPAMWYAVRQLTEEEQAYLLDGKAQAFHRLAALFLEWFSIKVQRRRPADRAQLSCQGHATVRSVGRRAWAAGAQPRR